MSTSDITCLDKYWRPISLKFDHDLADTFQIAHQVLQFIAITGKSLLPARFDDSHTSCSYDYTSNCFVGDWLHFGKTVRLEMDPVELKLALVAYRGNRIASVNMESKTKKEVYAQLRLMLSSADISVTHFNFDMHYDLPEHEVCVGGKYKMHDPIYHREISNCYHNSFLLLNLLKGKFPQAGDIRIWPHHFDITLDLEIDEKNNSQGNILTIGFAPPNFIIPEPYFFVALKYKPCAPVKARTKLQFGKWFAKEWHGTYLGCMDIISTNSKLKQWEVVYQFYKESIQNLVLD